MRYLLKCILCLCALPAMAQHFELGAGGGASHYDALTTFDQYKPITAPATYVKAICNITHYQVGVDLSLRTIIYTVPAYKPPVPPGMFLIEGYSEPSTGDFRIAQLPVKIFSDRKFSIGRVEAYAGPFAGCMWTWGKHVDHFDRVTTTWSGYKFMAGAQIGGTYMLNERIGMNLEAEGDCNNFQYLNNPLPKNNFIFPITAGMRYRL